MNDAENAYEKISIWINSCDTLLQLNCLISMPENFNAIYKNSILMDKLNTLIQNKTSLVVGGFNSFCNVDEHPSNCLLCSNISNSNSPSCNDNLEQLSLLNKI